MRDDDPYEIHVEAPRVESQDGSDLMSDDAYMKLIAMLDAYGAHYRFIDHAPEGRTDIVTPMRGHDLSAAAKCMILMIKLGKKTTKYVLAVVPGDRRVSLDAVKRLFNATYVSMATKEAAERLSGCAPGTILPFSFDAELTLVVDPSLQTSEELFFNAARLDRSVALSTRDYFALAKPQIASVAE